MGIENMKKDRKINLQINQESAKKLVHGTDKANHIYDMAEGVTGSGPFENELS